MAGSKSYAQSVINLEANVGYNPTVQKYLAIFTTAPTDTTAGTECSYAGYTRMAHSPGAATSVGGLATSVNTGTIVFPAVAGSTQTIVGTALMSASTGGTVIYYDDTVTSQAVLVGQSYIMTAGQAVFTET